MFNVWSSCWAFSSSAVFVIVVDNVVAALQEAGPQSNGRVSDDEVVSESVQARMLPAISECVLGSGSRSIHPSSCIVCRMSVSEGERSVGGSESVSAEPVAGNAGADPIVSMLVEEAGRIAQVREGEGDRRAREADAAGGLEPEQERPRPMGLSLSASVAQSSFSASSTSSSSTVIEGRIMLFPKPTLIPNPAGVAAGEKAMANIMTMYCTNISVARAVLVQAIQALFMPFTVVTIAFGGSERSNTAGLAETIVELEDEGAELGARGTSCREQAGEELTFMREGAGHDGCTGEAGSDDGADSGWVFTPAAEGKEEEGDEEE